MVGKRWPVPHLLPSWPSLHLLLFPGPGQTGQTLGLWGSRPEIQQQHACLCSACIRHQTPSLWLCQPLGAFRGLERSRWLIVYGAGWGGWLATFSLLNFPSPSLTPARSTLSRVGDEGRPLSMPPPVLPSSSLTALVSQLHPPSPDAPQISETLEPKITEERPSFWAISVPHPTADKWIPGVQGSYQPRTPTPLQMGP